MVLDVLIYYLLPPLKSFKAKDQKYWIFSSLTEKLIMLCICKLLQQSTNILPEQNQMRSLRRKILRYRTPNEAEWNRTWLGPSVSCKRISHSFLNLKIHFGDKPRNVMKQKRIPIELKIHFENIFKFHSHLCHYKVWFWRKKTSKSYVPIVQFYWIRFSWRCSLLSSRKKEVST